MNKAVSKFHKFVHAPTICTYYTLEMQIHLDSDVLLFLVIIMHTTDITKKKMHQTLHLFPTVALEVRNSLEFSVILLD